MGRRHQERLSRLNALNNAAPYRVGLTGGIASGKSTVATMFAERGVAVIDTDVIAREVVQPGQTALAEIEKCFGDAVIEDDGQLNRHTLRRLVFENNHKRLELEAILHPRIGAETRRQAELAFVSGRFAAPYQIIVVPLLVGSALLEFVDRVLLVDCNKETQIARLLSRDTETEAQARRILAAQASREDRLAIADDVIVNDHGLAETERVVGELDKKYRTICAPTQGGAE